MSDNTLKFTIGIRHIGCWLLVNILVATIPIWATLFSSFFQKTGFCSSILAYTFTLLVASLYIYTAVIKRIRSPEMLTIWVTIPIVLIVWGAYIALNYNFLVAQHMELYWRRYAIASLFIAMLLGGFLHWPHLKERIRDEFTDKQQESVERTKNIVKNMKKDL